MLILIMRIIKGKKFTNSSVMPEEFMFHWLQFDDNTLKFLMMEKCSGLFILPKLIEEE